MLFFSTNERFKSFCLFFFTAARVLLRVHVVCLRSLFAVRASSRMKRGKNTEETAADGENDTGSGRIECTDAESNTFEHTGMSSHELKCYFYGAASAKKAKKPKEPEAPVMYDDPPDKMTSKDGRNANLKVTSWNVDGLRAWVKKKGLDVSFTIPLKN